jgi:Peroxisomal membrane protein (Pex16)
VLRLSAMNILKEYDSYILKNAAQISSIESALRTITYILPSPSPLPSPLSPHRPRLG